MQLLSPFLTGALISIASLNAVTAQHNCDCPPPTNEDFMEVCEAVYENRLAPEGSKLSYAYQVKLYQMSCADPERDTPEEAYEKIRCMWEHYAPSFRCYSYPTSLASDKNVLKFSLETGNTALLMESIRRYKLDLNVIDPADGKTILDFTEESIRRIQNTAPVDESKLAFYQRVYELLRQNGAKHIREIRNEE